MEDDVRTALMQMHSPLTRSSSKNALETKNAKSNLIWALRRIIIIVLLLLELSKWSGKLAIEYLVHEGYFGKTPEKVEEVEEIDLDDTLPAILIRMLIQILIAAIFLPHIIAHFLPQLKSVATYNRNV